jgi:hypothetical protein
VTAVPRWEAVGGGAQGGGGAAPEEGDGAARRVQGRAEADQSCGRAAGLLASFFFESIVLKFK